MGEAISEEKSRMSPSTHAGYATLLTHEWGRGKREPDCGSTAAKKISGFRRRATAARSADWNLAPCRGVSCSKPALQEAPMHKEKGRTVETAVEARAGFRDRPVLVVLTVSLVIAAVVFGLLWLGFAWHTPPGA